MSLSFAHRERQGKVRVHNQHIIMLSVDRSWRTRQYSWMTSYDMAAWSVVVSLSLMMVGGLMLWAYGAHAPGATTASFSGLEADSVRIFHIKLARWFFIYGISLILAGALLLLWASSVLF